ETGPALISYSQRLVRLARPLGFISVRGDPGSAMHRFAAARAASHPGHAISCICHSYSRCQTAHLVPAARFCARGLHLCFAHPNEGWAERRETFGGSAEHPGDTPYGGVSGACEAPCVPCAGRSPLGAPPWRFWAPRAALLIEPDVPD